MDKIEKGGDPFLEKLAQVRHEVDKRQRLVIWKELMANADICPIHGAHRKNYREMMGEECCQ